MAVRQADDGARGGQQVHGRGALYGQPVHRDRQQQLQTHLNISQCTVANILHVSGKIRNTFGCKS